MAVLGLRCCAGFSLIKVDGLLIAAALRIATHGLLVMEASAVVARRLSSCGSEAQELRLSSCGAWA